MGNAGAEWPTRGFLQALDANTGKLVWRFNTTAAPDQPGGKSWSGDSWKYGGGSVWNTPAIDVKNNLILFAVGNPNPDLDGIQPQGRQRLYRLHRRHRQPHRQAALVVPGSAA